MPDILITEFMDESQVARLAKEYDVSYQPDLVSRQADIPALMAGVRGLIVRNATQVRGPVLDAADRLECVGRLGVGLDNIDMAACKARGIKVFPALGANADSVAELALGAIFVMFRRSFLATPDVVAGKWPRLELMGREVQGKRLGIIGFGATGQALAWRARGCGMSRIVYDPWVVKDDPRWAEFKADRAETLDDLLPQCDAISIHVPLTDDTRNLFNAETIAKMKDRALLLNLSRGGIVDEQALVDALKSGKLWGAFTDVFVEEPLTAPNIFDGVPNFYCTPHVGPRTEEGEGKVSSVTADAVLNCLNGN
ncbi:MAG: 3-phosphoglycerate dehydrogenase [Rhodospirillales bacterium CG15_BIG_FIL_POST_REV_8_21_14_020_66_15]|nr:MAG: 3-phosphoglycerate dehydrogenase [Rhodospirillales bacterium CG15_BIG_FIL_POST_REV_8_21_14_020_66_15]